MALSIHKLLQDLMQAHGLPITGAEGTRVKENALQLLSDDSSGRTNQFEVKARLEGIVEKCRILNKDPLGNALQTRLDELPAVSNRWTPEISSLLLALSDRPAHKTKVEDLALLEPEIPAAPLTWADIIEEDPLEDQTAIWQNTDFKADDSGEDEDVESGLSGSPDEEEGFEAFWTEGTEVDLETLAVTVDKTALEGVSEARSWRQRIATNTLEHATLKNDVFDIVELAAIREVLFMLLGLPTSIFEQDRDGNYKRSRNIGLRDVSQESATHILDNFIELGQNLSTIRQWIKTELDIPLEQSFQFALEERLNFFHSTLHAIQKRILDRSRTFVASLLDVYHEIRTSSRLIVQLHDILVKSVPLDKSQRPFEILQNLYDQTCINQQIGDDEGYEYVARFFFQCFQTYLKPILAWMDNGEIVAYNRIIFIEESNDEVSPHSLWQDQHRLLYSANGALKAPRFLRVSAKKIFITGKSVNFLDKLGVDKSIRNTQTYNEAMMTFEAVCLIADPRNLSPFPELFDTAFARWIASKHRSSSSLLRDQLESRCGLRRALTALEYVYFYHNGALSSSVVYTLFEKMDRGKRYWNDAFTTTELFHEAFAVVDCIDLDRLSIRPTASSHASHTKLRSMNILEELSVSYTLPWPIANIIRPQSMTTYQLVFTLLTQTSRAKFLLQRSKHPKNASSIFYTVHANLLWFVNTLLSHLTTLVIAVNTATMHHDMTYAEDVDAMITVHQAYIAKLEDQCFLTKQHALLRQAVISILNLTVLFSDLRDDQKPHPFATRGSRKGRSESMSSSNEEDEAHTAEPKPIGHSGLHPVERLAQIYDTYGKLLLVVTAAVEGVSKADGGPAWEILARNLAFGSVR